MYIAYILYGIIYFMAFPWFFIQFIKFGDIPTVYKFIAIATLYNSGPRSNRSSNIVQNANWCYICLH